MLTFFKQIYSFVTKRLLWPLCGANFLASYFAVVCLGFALLIACDSLMIVMLFVITTVSVLVHLYPTSYMSAAPYLARYSFFLLRFFHNVCSVYYFFLVVLLVSFNLFLYGLLVYHQSLYMLAYTLTLTVVAVFTLVVGILSVIYPQPLYVISFRYHQAISYLFPLVYWASILLLFGWILSSGGPLSAGSISSKPVNEVVVVSCAPAVKDAPPAFFWIVGLPLVVKEVTNPVGSAVCALDSGMVISWSTWLWSWFGYSGSKPTPMTGGVATVGGFTSVVDQGAVFTAGKNQEVIDTPALLPPGDTSMMSPGTPLERAFANQKAKMSLDLLSLQNLVDNLHQPALGDVPLVAPAIGSLDLNSGLPLLDTTLMDPGSMPGLELLPLLPLSENPHGYEPALVAMPGDLTPPVQEMPIAVAALIAHLRLLSPEPAFFHYFTLGEGEGAVRDAIFFGLDEATPDAYCILPLFPELAFDEIFFLRLADEGYDLDNAAYVAALERIVHVPHILNDAGHLTDLQCSTVQLVYNYFWDVSQNDPELFAQVRQLVLSFSSDLKIDLEIIKVFQEIDLNINCVETGEPHEIDCAELVRVFTGEGSDNDPSAPEEN